MRADEFAPYKKGAGVSGTIKSIGSDTMNNLMAEWCAGFAKFHQGVKSEINGPGSGQAPIALTQGTAQFGPMSRECKASEIEAFEKKFGYEPTGLRTSIDMLAVFVHKDCPLEEITLQQIDAIFSKNRKGGYEEDIATWGDLGLEGEWAAKTISLYGRDSTSGTNQYFKESALFKGDFKDAVKEQSGSSAVVSGVARDKFGIGYSGMGYLTPDVKALAIAEEKGEEAIHPDPTKFNEDYPLWRYLYVYVNYKPKSKLDPLRAEFIKYLYSDEGQTDVKQQKFLPLSPEEAADELQKVGLKPAK